MLILIGAYRGLSPVHGLGGACRFEPSCSEYAVDAVKRHRPLQAVRLITKRVSSCHPGGAWGFDPVPEIEDITT